MELQHLLGRNRVCKHIWRSMHLIQSSSTATAISFNWLVFNLQIALRESNTFIQHWLHCGIFFHYSPKRCQNLKEIQKVLDIPELKIVKPSDTRWLSHEKCVSTVKKCYGAIVSALQKLFIRNPTSRRHSVLVRSYRSPLHCLPYISLTTFSLGYPSWVNVSKQRSWICPSSQALWMLPWTLWKIYFNLQLSGARFARS